MIRNGRNESSSGSRDNRTGINEKVVEKRRDSMITLNFGILTVRVGICSFFVGTSNFGSVMGKIILLAIFTGFYSGSFCWKIGPKLQMR